MAHTKDLGNLSADKVGFETEFRKFWEVMQAKIDQIQVSLDDELERANGLESKRIRLLVSEKSAERQIQLMSEDSQEVDDLKYRLYRVVAK